MNVAFRIKSLAVSYSHMGRPHTTIGAERFHFRVRKGIGWFPLAIAARKTGWTTTLRSSSEKQTIWNISDIYLAFSIKRRTHVAHHAQVLWCYMAKPHEQLVLVSFIHY